MCTICGEWAGVASAGHDECVEASKAGKSIAEIRAMRGAAPQETHIHPHSLTAFSIFWVVFGALWAFALTAGVVYALLRVVI
jgi:hypothetical protein